MSERSGPAAPDAAPRGTAGAQLLGFVVILAFWGAGEAIARLTRAPLPGSVVGMLLLAGALQSRRLPLDPVADAARSLIRWMSLFFVPAGVALLLHLPLLRANWLAIVAAAVASIVAVLVTVGTLAQRLAPDA